MSKWPKKYISWIKNRILFVSVPFTWELPAVRWRLLSTLRIGWDRAVVGGPGIYLKPDYFSDIQDVEVGYSYPGVLQRINPLATRTTLGCPNKCAFCAVKTIEPEFIELEDWPNLPIICDNNLLAASIRHFDRVIDRLIMLGQADFNQGLDVQRLTDYHAMRIAEIKEPLVYLALDDKKGIDAWGCAYDRLRSAGLAKRKIRSYALVGFNSDPAEAWDRCNWIERHGIKAYPMFYHSLNAMNRNTVTHRQQELGWDDYERRKIMQWFYFHKRAVPLYKKSIPKTDKEKNMGGKSRKSGSVSKSLIDRLKSGNIGSSKCGNCKKKITKGDGFGLVDEKENTKE